MSTYEKQIYINIGKNVKKYRNIKGISQEKLSEMLGVNSKYIGHIERFERYVSLKRLIQISGILSTNLENLVSINNE